MRRVASFLVLGVSATTLAQHPALIPKPQQIEWNNGFATMAQLAKATRRLDRNLPAGGYRLNVSPKGVSIDHADQAGYFYAMQTLKQAMSGGRIPAFTCTDYPRFKWRGLHLDVSRHFFSTAFIKRQLDAMANLKMNVFHWHLTDDGGWRMQVDAYPKLTSIGAWRVDTGGTWPGGEWNQGNLQFLVPGVEGKRYGGFYTKAEIRDIVRYAAERHITVVPEIELPGHGLAVLVSYPELGCEGVAPNPLLGKNNTNVFCAGKEATFAFLEKTLTETLELFPSKWIHIGGDEVWKGHWQKCTACQSRMATEGLKDVDELQSYFIRRIETFLNRKGRSMVGWDEILEGGLAPNATVMSWRGISGGIAAAKSGHEVVMTPTSHCYFDYPYSSIPTSHVYGYDPVPAELSAQEAKYVIGVQGNVWTEWIATEDRAEEMTFPRGLAMAEIGWTNPENKDAEDFSRRVDAFTPWFAARKIDFMLAPPPLRSGIEFMTPGQAAEVRLPISRYLKLRYTVDGSDPTADSKVAPAMMWVREPGVLRFAYFAPDGRRSEIAGLSLVALDRMYQGALQPGLNRALYPISAQKMPDFRGKAISVGTADEISVAGAPAENYALNFTGYLRIAKAGVYTLHLTSDDGSNLLLAGSKLIDNDGLHGAVTKSATLRLPAGAIPLEVQMFQAGGAHSVKVEIEGEGVPRQELKGAWIGRT